MEDQNLDHSLSPGSGPSPRHSPSSSPGAGPDHSLSHSPGAGPDHSLSSSPGAGPDHSLNYSHGTGPDHGPDHISPTPVTSPNPGSCNRTPTEKKNLMKNKGDYDRLVAVGKSLLELILQYSDPRNIGFYEKVKEKTNMSEGEMKNRFQSDEYKELKKGITFDNLGKQDVSMVHKLIRFLCDLEEKDVDLENNVKVVKTCRNDISHKNNNIFTDFFVWKKMEELRTAFKEILNGINRVHHVDVSDKKNEIEKNVNEIWEKFEIELRESQLEEFKNQLNEGRRCPYNVKMEIKEDPRNCFVLDELVRRLGQENTKIKFMINKAYYDKFYYDCKPHLDPLINSGTCQLVSFRGNLSDEMICKLPSCIEQLYIRVRATQMLTQMESLNTQLPKLTNLWSFAIYIDFSEKSDTDPDHLEAVTPSSLIPLKYKLKQMGLRIGACITTDKIPWIVKVVKRLTQEHQCDTLEFYKTQLKTGDEIEELLRALNNAGVIVTGWVKLQTMNDGENGKAEEKRLSSLANKLYLSKFQFLHPWSLMNTEDVATPPVSNSTTPVRASSPINIDVANLSIDASN